MKPRLATVAAVVFASALMLAMQGYQFGKSNHTVYLLDAMRHASPDLLANDWFATRTLQYHAVFGWLTRWLFAIGAVKPAFLLGYLALLGLLHIAWWRIVRTLGGGEREFLVSAVLFQLLAAGTGLGMYQLLQDGAFLPSNIAAVATLWAIAMAMERRRNASGVWLGVAALFHLNYAVVAPVIWIALNWRRWSWMGALAAMAPAIVNVAFALRATSTRSGAMPLAEFVALYVKLRHPHHYDPASWPWWLWASFLLPLPFAVILFRRNSAAARGWATFLLLLVVALIGAGLIYLSETLVQASLYRFSVFVKLLSCVAVAIVVARTRHHLGVVRRGCLIIAACLWRGPYAGMFAVPEDEPAYLSTCDWIRDRTDRNDVFLVPPGEQEFRLRAQRAIVVNFKAVPQLSAELIEWRNRLRDVLDMPDLAALPRPFAATLAEMDRRYAAMPPAHLTGAARKYGARYVLTRSRWPAEFDAARIDLAENAWFLYDLSRLP